jgi:hypothetical protein
MAAGKDMSRGIGIPPSRNVKLRYADFDTLTTSVGTTDSFQLAANGLYDPYLSGTGHQPMGFDQWSAFYNHYVVKKARIKASFAMTSDPSNGVGWLVYGITRSATTTVPTDWTTLVEEGNTTWGFEKFRPRVSSKDFTVTLDLDVAKFFQVKDLAAKDSLNALVTANPSDNAVFTVWVAWADTSETAVLTVNVAYHVDFEAQFYEPKNLAAS